MSDRRASAEVERIRTALATVAQLVIDDPVYVPIFERLERELEIAEAATSKDMLARARAVVAAYQMASP